MNTLLLQPTDVLFFRDGRPMGGSLAGHGAAWPLPTVTNAALHAALWRSSLPGHPHDHRHGRVTAIVGARKFGSLVTAGPFPVRERGTGVPPVGSVGTGVPPESVWYFPRPLDLLGDNLTPTLLPAKGDWPQSSSLPKPLRYAVASIAGPSKEKPAKTWLCAEAFYRYLLDGETGLAAHEASNDRDFSDSEHNIGIGIDPATGTQDGKSIYSAHYLRLREGWRLGLCAATSEKTGAEGRADLIPELINVDGDVMVGGQQRLCTAECHRDAPVPFPHGHYHFKADHDGKVRLKWVLLSPAIFPAIEVKGATHPGGWLPSWVRQTDGAVQLRAEAKPRWADNPRETRDQWRARVQAEPMIQATLVAAIVPKPIPVTGWSLGDEDLGVDGKAGAKPTLLAVPAGAVYYFEAKDSVEAAKLADALNWHGAVTGDPAKDHATIKNRRSTLLGEKGFGLGVCGTWQFHGGATRDWLIDPPPPPYGAEPSDSTWRLPADLRGHPPN